MAIVPKKGLRFLHARVLNSDDNNPRAYIVTKVARGTAYYRPLDGGGPDCCPVEQFSRWVLKELA